MEFSGSCTSGLPGVIFRNTTVRGKPCTNGFLSGRRTKNSSSYTYTASGAVHSLECTESGRKYQYSYNSRGQLIGYTELAVRENAYTDLSQSFFWYDDLNRLDYAQTTFRYAVGDTNYLSEADYYDAVG